MARCPWAGVRLVPVLVVAPPAYDGPVPTMKAVPVKSTGSGEAAASCPACAGGAARARATRVARAARGASACGDAGAGVGADGGRGGGVTSTARSMTMASWTRPAISALQVPADAPNRLTVTNKPA